MQMHLSGVTGSRIFVDNDNLSMCMKRGFVCGTIVPEGKSRAEKICRGLVLRGLNSGISLVRASRLLREEILLICGQAFRGLVTVAVGLN